DPGAPRRETWSPEHAPGGIRLLADALLERTVSPYEVFRSARAGLRAPRQFAGALYDTARGLIGMRGLVRRTPPSSLNGPIGPHRHWSWARSQLSDVKAVRAA